MRFVLVKHEDGKYVSRPGSLHSYTKRLEKALVFTTRAAAEKSKCGNESVVDLDQLLGLR
jgi:hypothetical protein